MNNKEKLEKYLEGVKERQFARELAEGKTTAEFVSQTESLPEPLRSFHKFTGYGYTRLELPNCDPIRLNWNGASSPEIDSCEVERLDWETGEISFETIYGLEDAIFAAQDSTLAEAIDHYSNDKLLELAELAFEKDSEESSIAASLLVIARMIGQGKNHLPRLG